MDVATKNGHPQGASFIAPYHLEDLARQIDKMIHKINNMGT